MADEPKVDCVRSEEDSSFSDDQGDSEDFDKDMAELITISRRRRKRDTSIAFSPAKEDDRKKSRDHQSLDHDTERMFTHTWVHTY